MEMNIRLLVDMEWTYVNPACSAFASAMMKAFNKDFPLAFVACLRNIFGIP